jgi:hypothetical protein
MIPNSQNPTFLFIHIMGATDVRLFDHASLRSVRRMRNPFRAISWRGFFQHTINLFERKAFGFGNKEVSVDETGGAEGTPDKEDF